MPSKNLAIVFTKSSILLFACMETFAQSTLATSGKSWCLDVKLYSNGKYCLHWRYFTVEYKVGKKLKFEKFDENIETKFLIDFNWLGYKKDKKISNKNLQLHQILWILLKHLLLILLFVYNIILHTLTVVSNVRCVRLKCLANTHDTLKRVFVSVCLCVLYGFTVCTHIDINKFRPFVFAYPHTYTA